MRTSHYSLQVLIVSLAVATGSAVAQASLDLGDPPIKHWTLNLGGGYSPVVGGYNHTITDGWDFTVGTGYNFTKKLGLNLEYMNNHLGVDNGVLQHFSNQFGGVATDGTANVWSVTLNPKWNFEINRIVGGYFIGGGGYYHVRATLTTPTVAYVPPYCDYYWGCWPGGLTNADKIIGEHKDDTGGVNVGMGFTFNINPDMQFYIESRYHYILMHGPDLQLLPLVAGFRF